MTERDLTIGRGTALAIVLAAGGCTHRVEVEPIRVDPIFITLDINLRVDRELDSFFDFQDDEPQDEPQDEPAGATP